MQRRARRFVYLARLGEHNHPLGPGARISHAEYGDAPLPNSRYFRHRLLDFLRIEMPPRADDDVLHASGYVDITSRHIGAVATVQPTVPEKLARFGLVSEIAAGR